MKRHRGLSTNLGLIALCGCLLFLASANLCHAQFYKGKTLRITVGYSAGGGFDLWARLVGRHIGKHVPGNPSVVVENITGAGGLIQINNLFKAAKPDGLTIGHITGSLLLSQMFGQPGYDFDAQKFIYVGAATKENSVFFLDRRSGITSAEKWRTSPTPVKVGGVAPGIWPDNLDRVMKGVLGFPTHIVSGYKGVTDILVAMDSGELTGGNGSWNNIKTNRKRQIEEGSTIVVVQCVSKPIKQLPNVPRMIDLAKTEEQKKMIDVIVQKANDYSMPFAGPPGIPADRVEILRTAFVETMKDKEFLTEVDKMQLNLEPTTGEELAAAAMGVTRLDPPTMAKLKDILFGK